MTIQPLNEAHHERLNSAEERLGARISSLPAWRQVALLLALPFLVQLSGAYELFPRPGWVDPMIYVGYFLDPAAQIREYGPYYFSQRIPFIVIGSFFYKIFSPAYAHIALTNFFQITALLSLYYIGKRAGGMPVGLAAGWWLGTNPLWLASISSGYVDGPAIALALATIGFCMFGADQSKCSGGLWRNAAAGFFFACVLALHPVPALLTAAALVFSFRLLPSTTSITVRMTSTAAGFLFGMFLMSIYSQAIGGPFLFFLNDSAPIRNAFAGNALPFIRPIGEWLPGAFRISMPFIILFLAAALLIQRNKVEMKASRQLAALGLLTLLSSVGVIVVWDALLRGLMAQTWFYASYLLIGEGLLVAFIASALLEGCKKDASYDICTVLAAGIVVAATLLFHEGIAEFVDRMSRAAAWIAIGAAAVFVVMLAVKSAGRSAVVGLALLTSVLGIANADTRFTFTKSETVPFRALFQLALDIQKVTKETNLQGRRVALWMDRSNFTTGNERSDEHAAYDFFIAGNKLSLNTFDSVAALWLWDRGTINFNMPTVSQENEAWLKAQNIPTSLVLLCTTAYTCGQGHITLDTLKIPTEVRSRTIIWESGLKPITLLIVDYLLPPPDPN
ncbi:hypothetical protein Kim5_CH00899 [Rhizobium sp. Kim5]|uniref:hypothetical protein n=1 Tax=Rhizobium sp. Kim5 TaxID=2020311 RepID=UPI000A2A3FC8|nr:hypothetical protein [Rhizobium sp. Kim5]ARQ57006.1 hypothetical protein Kim5_CH00899 [Rhizobium sp. Kim5]